MIGHRGEDFKNLYRAIIQDFRHYWNKAASVPFHLFGVGRDGSIHPEPGRSWSALLHVRRVLG